MKVITPQVPPLSADENSRNGFVDIHLRRSSGRPTHPAATGPGPQTGRNRSRRQSARAGSSGGRRWLCPRGRLLFLRQRTRWPTLCRRRRSRHRHLPQTDPEKTIAKARVLQAAANAPADPSGQDRAVAAAAAQMEAAARQELSTKQQEQAAAAYGHQDEQEPGRLLSLLG